MIRNIAVMALAVILSACEAPASEWTGTKFKLENVDGFEDCTMTRINTGERRVHAIRCPNSTVSTHLTVGKAQQDTTVIDVPQEPVAAARRETFQCTETPAAPGVLTCTRQSAGE